MIKAIIFDCFGVLVAGSLEQFIDKHFSEDEKLAHEAHRINDRASLGHISYKDQLEQFAEMSGTTLEQVKKEMDKNPRNALLIKYINDNLFGKYKLGFLSNASDDWLEELFTKDDLKMFDNFVLSYQVGLAKPHPKIYEIAAKGLGLDARECLFIDDIERYCEGAEEVGMKAICYKNFNQFKKELEQKLAANTDS